MRQLLAVVAGLGMLFAPGCIHDDRPSAEREGLGSSRAPVIKAPKTDRCARATGDNVKPCLRARDEAKLWARRLAPSDMICLENGVGMELTDTCLTRAAAIDVAQNHVLVEIRASKPESRYFDKQDSDMWFEEGALVDLYLAERGY